jgi:hypothetical protein
MESFEGTVEGANDAIVLADATMRIGKQKVVERLSSKFFVLRLEDGRGVRIEGVERAEKEGRYLLKGAYGTLLDGPLAGLFRKRAPGDHVSVELQGFALAGGDRVRVLGEVIAHETATTPGDEGGLREAPARVPSVVRASRLIIEGNAPSIVTAEEKATSTPAVKNAAAHRAARSLRPLGTSTRIYALLGVVLTFGSIAAMSMPLEAWRNWLSPTFSLGLVFLAIAAVRRLRAVHHAPYVSIVQGPPITSPNPVWGYGLDVPLFVFGLGMLSTFPVLESRPSVVTVCACGAALVPLLHGLIVLWQERAFRRFGRLVLFAQSASADGRMGRIEGTVAPSTKLSREVTFVETSSTYYTTDKNGHSVERTTTTVTTRVATQGEAFTIVTSEGEVQVEPKGAQAVFAARAWQSGATPRYQESSMAKVVVVGRKHEGKVEAGGDESLFVWAGSRASLMRTWLVAYLRPLAFFALSAALAWLAFHLMPFAETWHVQGTTAPTASGMTTYDAYVIRYLYNDTPRCTVYLHGGGESLYGGFGMGQMACSGSVETSLQGEDADANDGDPALRFNISSSADGEVVWSTATRVLSIQVRPAARLLWH